MEEYIGDRGSMYTHMYTQLQITRGKGGGKSTYTFTITVTDGPDDSGSFKLGQPYTYQQAKLRNVESSAWYGDIQKIEKRNADSTWDVTEEYQLDIYNPGHGQAGVSTFTVSHTEPLTEPLTESVDARAASAVVRWGWIKF